MAVHRDYGQETNTIVWMLTALAAVFLGLRVFCKFLRHRGLWWDDHILIAAWVSCFTGDILDLYSIWLTR
jgi:hypothetical protein